MNEDDILKIVNEAFDYHEIDDYSDEENIAFAVLSGKSDFINEVKTKLHILFDENDLSK